MSFLQRVWAIVWKDLRSEFRTKETMSTMLIFSFLVILIFSFAFDPAAGKDSAALPGILWVAFFFAGTLGLSRSISSERANDTLQGLMLCPVDWSAIFFGKAFANLVLMLVTEIVTLPVFIGLFGFSFKGDPGLLAAVMVLGSVGFVVVGTFLATLSANTRTSELLLPVIMFPILVPIVIAVVRATGTVVSGGLADDMLPWLRMLGVYDLIFLVMPFILFEYLLEG